LQSTLDAAAASAIDPMAPDMRQVDAVIRERLASQVALINQISTYIVSAGGKRIRPRLVLLFAQALGFEGPERFELAATVEFIHTATLLHDDVVDESSLRRGRATANALFGNAASVLVGDFLYSRAFQMMVSVNRVRVLDVLADATNVIAEGEVLQLMNMHDPDITVEEYLRVIRYKTAKLFEASARLGAVLAGADAALEDAAPPTAARSARPFSWSTTCWTTKATATNSARTSATTCGRASRPCRCLWRCSAARTIASLIRAAIEHGEVERLPEIITLVRRTGALEATRAAAEDEADRARDCIECCPTREPAKLC
jgi:octaprenyl-diphosphate synthase